MTNTEEPRLPPPGPAGYQPQPGEGIDDVVVSVERDGVTIRTSYVFDTPRPTGLAIQAIAELQDAVAAMLVPKVTAEIPPVAAPAPPVTDPAAAVRPPAAGSGAGLVEVPAALAPAGMRPAPFPQPAPVQAAPSGLEAMRQTAWGGANDSPAAVPAVPDTQDRIREINARNMGSNPAF